MKLLKFGGDVNPYFNSVVKVMVQYAVVQLNDDLINLIKSKVDSATNTKIIIDHLNADNANNFERLCTKISMVQVGITVVGVEDKKYERKYGGGRGGQKGGSNKQFNFYHAKGNTESRCWKKFPDKAPHWIRIKIKVEKAGNKTSGVEIMLASVNGIENHDLNFQQALC